ncbi:MAG TPA: sensor histidine kinase, partial [Opitutaceae bacterium]
LSFDRFGRISVIHEGTYYVLNDNVWLNIPEYQQPDGSTIANIIQAPDGQAYYGARGSWGKVETEADGKLHPVPLNQKGRDSWVATAIFGELLAGGEGVYFSSWNGFAYWDFQRQASFSFNLPEISKLFRVGERTFISMPGAPLCYLDTKKPSIELAPGTELDKINVEYSTPLDATRSLVALSDGRILVFDGKQLSPWTTSQEIPVGHISAFQQLTDGKIAIGISGKGLFLYSNMGQLILGLTSSTYFNVTALANREPGILWLQTENMVQKVLYGSPVTSFGQEQGLPTEWPVVVSWKGQILVTSGGKLYSLSTDSGRVGRFNLVENQPPTSVQTATVCGSRLLVGGKDGTYSVESDGTYRSISTVDEVAHLVSMDADHCFAIGRREIAFLEWQNGRWTEVTPRVAGIPSPSIPHRIGQSVWIEMGADGVARLRKIGGSLKLDILRNETWTKSHWVNIGAFDDVAVFSGLPNEQRRFFDERKNAWVKLDDIETLLDSSPQWIARIFKDSLGTIWATHNQGLMRFLPEGEKLLLDSYGVDLVNDEYPMVSILPQDDIWVTSARSLYHVDSSPSSRSIVSPSPFLVSVLNAQHELLVNPIFSGDRLKIPFTDNTLSLRFFSGTDLWRKPPAYEYRINDTDPWTQLDGSVLSFHGLREGTYKVQVRIAHLPESVAPFALYLVVSPPWQRSWAAYLCVALALLLSITGMIRYIRYIERKRARKLELLVRERTQQLEEATIRLSEEARKAATLTERDRVANEIHDSVQQGLTGAILQLDTTMKLGIVVPEVRSRLNMVRSVVSYVRQEVQRTIWDVESPLLEDSTLGDALRNFTKFIDTEGALIAVDVAGVPTALRPTISHNLLRIAQEATTNALKHAKASRIIIRLLYQNDTVSLEIKDNGIGFNPDVALEGVGHLGLRSMRVRAKRLNSKLFIESRPGEGTSIRVVTPMNEIKFND